MQLNNLTRWLQGYSAYPWAWVMRKTMAPIYDRMSSLVLNPAGAGLVITGAGSTTVKTGASITYCICNGVFVAIPAATNMAALAGTIPQNTFGGWMFFVDQGGTTSSLPIGSGTTVATWTWPQFPPGKACLGMVYLNPTTAAFIGGTTLLDAANTNAIYISFNDSLDPYCTIGGILGSS